MIYDVDYFINKFKAIPEDKWCVDGYEDNYGNRCALGHCGEITSITDESMAAVRLFNDSIDISIIDVNDRPCYNYLQPTPKQRILAALYDIKKLNSEPLVKECDATMPKKVDEVGNIKTKIVYVSVPETISKSVPETILS